jgi:hypothetical protein
MARKRHSEEEVLRALRYKRDVRVSGKTVAVLKDKVLTKEGETVLNPNKSWDLGNGSWGKIDYLVKEHGYYIWHTDKFGK